MNKILKFIFIIILILFSNCLNEKKVKTRHSLVNLLSRCLDNCEVKIGDKGSDLYIIQNTRNNQKWVVDIFKTHVVIYKDRKTVIFFPDSMVDKNSCPINRIWNPPLPSNNGGFGNSVLVCESSFTLQMPNNRCIDSLVILINELKELK